MYLHGAGSRLAAVLSRDKVGSPHLPLALPLAEVVQHPSDEVGEEQSEGGTDGVRPSTYDIEP